MRGGWYLGKRPFAALRFAIALTLAASAGLGAGPAEASPARGSFIVIEAESGDVIRSRRAREEMHPASQTQALNVRGEARILNSHPSSRKSQMHVRL